MNQDSSLTDIENMDPLIEKFLGKKEYRNKDDPTVPQWPFRALITGSSSLGKTNVVLNMILKQLVWDKIYIYIKDETEDKYQFLLAFLESLQNQFNELNGGSDERIYEFSTNPDDVVKLEDLDKEKQNLILFDDFVVDKNQEKVEHIFIRGRKRNASVIYQTQNLFAVPKNIRKNASHVLMFPTNNREIKELAKTYATQISYDEFVELFKEATNEPFNFFMIDEKAKELCLRYRKNFNELMIPCNNE
ncbi:MAG: hypothetical protein KF880_09450 [Ferruginibacter sp.]|nr:hypothetical protein [Ferruginibacter sp.]